MKLIDWVKSHDWGRDAHLSDDGLQILDIHDEGYSPSGVLQDDLIALPASYRMISEWAGY